jgi:catechol 2,3-dioxygenase-like lactoylglutathione lyase family enzyme
MTITGCYPVLLTRDVEQARHFFERLFGFVPRFASDWYVQLAHPAHGCEIAVMTTQHASLPAAAQTPAAGVLLSFEVPDASIEYVRLLRLGAAMVHTVRDEAWGQRHFLLQGPDGVFIDVIEQIAPDAEHAAAYTGAAP